MMPHSFEDSSTNSFHINVTRAIQKLEDLLKLPSTPHLHKTQQQIINEHIFCTVNSNNTKLCLTPMEELVLVRALSQHLAQMPDEALRNSLFITVFPVVSTPATSKVLSTLLSLSVATHNVAILEAAAVWMQQVGCLSSICSDVCQNLIRDFLQASEESVLPAHFWKALVMLPTSTPLFATNLTTALAQIYAKIGTIEPCSPPPLSLVHLVVQWLHSSPLLPLTPLTTALPGISLPMAAVPPILPLAKWCIEAPFFNNVEYVSKQNNCVEVVSSEKMDKMSKDLFSELHFLLLQTLQAVPSIRDTMTQREVLCVDHLKSVIESVACYKSQQQTSSQTVPTCSDAITNDAIQTSLDRLSQIILVAVNTECISGRTVDIWTSISKLPLNSRLMSTLNSKLHRA